MRQPRTRLCFAFESPQRLAIAERAAAHDLDRDAARQAQVRRLVDGAHAALADQAVDAVLAIDRPLDGQRQRQLRPVGRAGRGAGVVALPARRALLQQVDVTGLEMREHVVAQAAIVIDAFLQADVFPRDRNLPRDGLQQLQVLARIRLVGFLVAEHEEAHQVALRPDHRHDQSHARFLEPLAIGVRQRGGLGERQLDDAARALGELQQRRRRRELDGVDVAARRIGQREIRLVALAVPDEEALRVERAPRARG